MLLPRGQVDILAKRAFFQTCWAQRRPHDVVMEDPHVALEQQVENVLVYILLLGGSIVVLDEVQEAKLGEATVTGHRLLLILVQM